MDHFAGLDVSLKETAACIVDAAGQLVAERKVLRSPTPWRLKRAKGSASSPRRTVAMMSSSIIGA